MCICLTSFIAACGGGGGGSGSGSGSTPTPTLPQTDVSGTYKGTVKLIYKTNTTYSGDRTVTVTAVQTNSSLTGTFSSSAGGMGPVSGNITGNSFTLNYSNWASTFNGNPCSESGQVTGTYSNNALIYTGNGTVNCGTFGSDTYTSSANLIKQ
jgi:hypothetical protein